MTRFLCCAMCAGLVSTVAPPYESAVADQTIASDATQKGCKLVSKQSGQQFSHLLSIAKSMQSAPIRDSHPMSGLLYRPPGIQIGDTRVGECYVVLENREVRLGLSSYEWVKIVHVDEWNQTRPLTGWTYWGKPGEAESPNFKAIGFGASAKVPDSAGPIARETQ